MALWSCDCNSGNWQPFHPYKSFSVLWSYDFYLRPFLLASHKQSQWGIWEPRLQLAVISPLPNSCIILLSFALVLICAFLLQPSCVYANSYPALSQICIQTMADHPEPPLYSISVLLTWDSHCFPLNNPTCIGITAEIATAVTKKCGHMIPGSKITSLSGSNPSPI